MNKHLVCTIWRIFCVKQRLPVLKCAIKSVFLVKSTWNIWYTQDAKSCYLEYRLRVWHLKKWSKKGHKREELTVLARTRFARTCLWHFIIKITQKWYVGNKQLNHIKEQQQIPFAIVNSFRIKQYLYTVLSMHNAQCTLYLIRILENDEKRSFCCSQPKKVVRSTQDEKKYAIRVGVLRAL